MISILNFCVNYKKSYLIKTIILIILITNYYVTRDKQNIINTHASYLEKQSHASYLEKQ